MLGPLKMKNRLRGKVFKLKNLKTSFWKNYWQRIKNSLKNQIRTKYLNFTYNFTSNRVREEVVEFVKFYNLQFKSARTSHYSLHAVEISLTSPLKITEWEEKNFDLSIKCLLRKIYCQTINIHLVQLILVQISTE